MHPQANLLHEQGASQIIGGFAQIIGHLQNKQQSVGPLIIVN